MRPMVEIMCNNLVLLSVCFYVSEDLYVKFSLQKLLHDLIINALLQISRPPTADKDQCSAQFNPAIDHLAQASNLHTPLTRSLHTLD